jgi:T5SS/PEP-CTERM-associated repeat protein
LKARKKRKKSVELRLAFWVQRGSGTRNSTDAYPPMKTKSSSRTPRILVRNVILLTLAALAFCTMPTAALAADCVPVTNWTYPGTDSWFVSRDWDSGEPDLSTAAKINNGGTAQINTSTPTAAACELTLGFDATQSGNVSVSTGNLSVQTEAEIGAFGKGTLTLTNGASASVGFLTIAALGGASSVGTVSVDASSLTCTSPQGIWVGGDPNSGAGGIGLLAVTNGGTVSAGTGSGVVQVFSSGTLTGNGTVSTTSTTTIEGTLEPSGGRLTISGDVTFSGNAALMLSTVTPSSQDNVYVSGAASLTGRLKVTMTGTFTLGTTYTLLHAENGLGNTQFQSYSISYPTCHCFTPVIQYDAHNVNLYLQPVPCC